VATLATDCRCSFAFALAVAGNRRADVMLKWAQRVLCAREELEDAPGLSYTKQLPNPDLPRVSRAVFFFVLLHPPWISWEDNQITGKH